MGKIKIPEVLEDYKKRKLDWKLELSSEAPLSYVRRQVDLANEILFCVEIPWPFLLLWNNFHNSTSGQNVNYVDFLNSTVMDAWVVVKSECAEERLSKQSATVKTFESTKGRKREQLKDKVYKLSVSRGKIESIDRYKSKVIKTNELEKYKKNCSDLEEHRDNQLEQMMNEKDKMVQEISDLTLVKKELAENVESLEKIDFLNCQGGKMHEVGSKQKGRKLQVLKNKAQCALWFMKSFGRENSQIKLKDDGGSNNSFHYAVDHGTFSGTCVQMI